MNRQVRSSLEAEVDIVFSKTGPVLELLQREGMRASFQVLEVWPQLMRISIEEYLKTLFIVSDCKVCDEGSLGTTPPSWVHKEAVDMPDSEEHLTVRVRPATQGKCPRCWTFTRPDEQDVCSRCSVVLKL